MRRRWRSCRGGPAGRAGAVAAATDDHQRKNARVLEQAGGAAVIDERELSGSKLADVVSALLADSVRLETMGQAMRAVARPDAASQIVARLLELAS